MALNIVTGGTTDAADGTLVSSSNKITFTALNSNVTVHIRTDADTYSADQTFSVPAQVEVSFNGGGAWSGSGSNPISVGADVADLNAAVLLRQVITATSPTGTLTTNGTFTACSALSAPTLTATAGRKQVSLSWTNVSNESGYTIERGTDGVTYGTTVTSPAADATSYTDTGLAAGTTYYYRIKAVGTGRYSDSSYGTSGAVTTYSTGFTSASTSSTSYPLGVVEGPDNNIWATLNNGSKIARITPSGGTVDEFAVPSSGTNPVGICVLGSNIWYCNNGTSSGITKISTFSGTPTQTHYTSGFTAPYACTAGPDGNLWVTDGQYFRKVNPSTGAVTASYDAGSGHDLRWICSDGTALYAADRHSATGSVTRCSTSGTVASTACTDASAGPWGICYDPAAGKIMLTALGLGKIYKITPGASPSFDAGYTVNAASLIAYACVGPDGRIYTAGYDSSYKNIYSMPSGGGSFTTETAVSAGSGVGEMCLHSSGALWLAEYSAAAKVSRYVKA